jgi:peptidyl-prolyl cis-trans isomerase SurA
MKSLAIKRLIFFLLFPVYLVNAQDNDPVLLTIDNQSITKSEFLRIYNKNNAQNNPDSKNVHEYLDMFINYKLKVIESMHLGFDTVSSFVKEYKGYRDQLAKPYLNDNATDERLMKEAYERMLFEIHVRHIAIKSNSFSSPADTLKAYNKALEVRGKLLKGEPWDSVALKYSDDQSVKKSLGELNYITAFQSYYPFELAAFKLKVGDYSMPVHSRFGYHIINVLDRRPARGEIRVAHIMAAFPENGTPNAIDSARIKINYVYAQLQAGAKFDQLAITYSDDKRTAEKGGELNWFGVGQMIPEFENAAFSLAKDGDFTAPIRTTFGWHIIKRISTRPISKYDNVKDFIKGKILRDERADMGREALAEKIKKEINFKDNPEKLELLINILDSSFLKNHWSPEKANVYKNEILFNLKEKSYSVRDFAGYMVVSSHYRRQNPLQVLVHLDYKEYVLDKVIEFENDRLEQKYPEFRYLVQEYHDGILLFNLMEEKIWAQAAKDTIGLEKYFNEHKDIYKWGERVEALVVTSPDKKLVDEAYKYAEDYYAGKMKSKDILDKVCKEDSTKSCLNITESLFEKGDNTILDSIGWSLGISKQVFRDGKYGFFIKKGTKAPAQKTLQDSKGVCIADYQQLLEQQFLTEMRKKYKIVVNEKLLESLNKK